MRELLTSLSESEYVTYDEYNQKRTTAEYMRCFTDDELPSPEALSIHTFTVRPLSSGLIPCTFSMTA